MVRNHDNDLSKMFILLSQMVDTLNQSSPNTTVKQKTNKAARSKFKIERQMSRTQEFHCRGQILQQSFGVRCLSLYIKVTERFASQLVRPIKRITQSPECRTFKLLQDTNAVSLLAGLPTPALLAAAPSLSQSRSHACFAFSLQFSKKERLLAVQLKSAYNHNKLVIDRVK